MTSLAHLFEVNVPETATSRVRHAGRRYPQQAPEFVQQVLARIMAGDGDSLPVSAMPVDGTYPTGTSQWEKRNLALEIPVWEQEICIQCGKCVMVCPHAVIRAKVCDPALLAGAPDGISSPRRPAGRIASR